MGRLYLPFATALFNAIRLLHGNKLSANADGTAFHKYLLGYAFADYDGDNDWAIPVADDNFDKSSRKKEIVVLHVALSDIYLHVDTDNIFRFYSPQ